jgi:hypothetical protein
LKNLSYSEDRNRAWENIKENIKTSGKGSLGLYELKQHKPRVDKECLCFLDRRKQAKIQWIQNTNQNNIGILSNVRPEAS